MAPSAANTKKILLIEYDKAFMELLDSVLVTEGFKVVKTSSGDEAMSQMNTVNPDLIILELVMSGMSGIEIIRHLQSEGLGSIPIFVLADRLTEKKKFDDEQAIRMERNVTEFIRKPLRMAWFLLRIHQVLETTPKSIEKNPQGPSHPPTSV